MNRLPYLYMKTPMQLEYIKDDDCEFEVQTCIEKKKNKNDKSFDVVISKNILFDDGYEESFLLKYAKGLKDLDEVEDLCDEVILADREE